MSDSVRPHPWDSPGTNTGVGCHFLLQCIKVKSESEVTQSCVTLRDPMDCSPPGSSVHGILTLEWGAIAFSDTESWNVLNTMRTALWSLKLLLQGTGDLQLVSMCCFHSNLTSVLKLLSVLLLSLPCLASRLTWHQSNSLLKSQGGLFKHKQDVSAWDPSAGPF